MSCRPGLAWRARDERRFPRSGPGLAGPRLSRSEPTLLVDLSNVCRDERLGGDGAMLARWTRVLSAWREQVDRAAVTFCVADRSLLAALADADRERLRRSRASGEAVVVDHADRELLRLARAFAHASILSCDRFVDARRRHGWIESERRRFYAWTVREGHVRITRAHMVARPFEISRAAQRKALFERGFRAPAGDPSGDPARDPALRLRWRCESELPCVTRAFHPEELRVWPLRRGDVVVCPGCGAPLVPVGDRALGVEVKILLGDRELDRLTLRDRDALVLGRETIPDDSPLAALVRSGALTGLSRRHAELRVAGKRLRVIDLRSTNGTYVRVWNARARRYGPRVRLAPGAERTLGVRDRVELGSALIVERSGKPLPDASEFGPAAQATPSATERTSRDL